MMAAFKAYFATIHKMPDFAAIYWAETAGKARYQCYLQVRNSGFEIEFADIRIRRWSEDDTLSGDRE